MLRTKFTSKLSVKLSSSFNVRGATKTFLAFFTIPVFCNYCDFSHKSNLHELTENYDLSTNLNENISPITTTIEHTASISILEEKKESKDEQFSNFKSYVFHTITYLPCCDKS